eukprot:2875290-Rhodomonas_salina.2
MPDTDDVDMAVPGRGARPRGPGVPQVKQRNALDTYRTWHSASVGRIACIWQLKRCGLVQDDFADGAGEGRSLETDLGVTGQLRDVLHALRAACRPARCCVVRSSYTHVTDITCVLRPERNRRRCAAPHSSGGGSGSTPPNVATHALRNVRYER